MPIFPERPWGAVVFAPTVCRSLIYSTESCLSSVSMRMFRHHPGVESAYRSAVDRYWPDTPPIAHLERFAFYERAKEAFAVVMTGDTAKYGNLILTKGVTPVP
jgi:L-fucose mutarotase/ribose pyranase (RbsD/FucU family)